MTPKAWPAIESFSATTGESPQPKTRIGMKNSPPPIAVAFATTATAKPTATSAPCCRARARGSGNSSAQTASQTSANGARPQLQ